MDKKELRRLVKSAALKSEYKKSASEIIQQKVIASEQFRKSKSIFVYVSLPNEPATDMIINTALEHGKAVCVPKCISEGKMIAVRINSMSDLKPGAFGIREPVSDTAAEKDFDLCIIPCVAASPDGKRLGHGAGFYDRFLENLNTFKMCLCFEKNIFEDIPVDEHDILADMIVTELN